MVVSTTPLHYTQVNNGDHHITVHASSILWNRLVITHIAASLWSGVTRWQIKYFDNIITLQTYSLAAEFLASSEQQYQYIC